MAGNTLNITCNFLYCNHQVNRDFLITLYDSLYLFLSAGTWSKFGLHVGNMKFATHNEE
jgi:hypothetical protein